MAWEIILHAEVHTWFLALCKNDPSAAEKVEEALDELALQGPKLGRPLSIGSTTHAFCTT